VTGDATGIDGAFPDLGTIGGTIGGAVAGPGNGPAGGPN
jgi:hypothetical protein